MACDFMEELVIVGGGVAGLSCLNALLDRGISPLLLEASTIGSPKMCGEFLAPPVVEQFKQWEIGPVQVIKQALFFGATKSIQCLFPREAGAYARDSAELELAARAKKHGGRIVEQSPIQNITPATHNTPYMLHLMTGETLLAREVIFATGTFSQPPKASTYVGFKTHVSQVIQPETLLMFSVPGGYLGVVPVASEISNITCLVQRAAIEKAGSYKTFVNNALAHYGVLIDDEGWAKAHPTLEGPAPAFGPKTIPNWPHAYWIGDAFASFHPAIGYGFAHSVSSALLAADFYLKRDPVGFHQVLRQQVRSIRIIGQCMHSLLQKPRLCSVVSPLLGSNSWLNRKLLTTLGY